MNKQIIRKTLSALFAAAFVLASCAGTPTDVAAERETTPAPVYWTGNGGAGLSIAVLAPEGRGITANEAYLPILVQGVLVGDLAKFSAMKVLDRQNLEKVIAGGESGFVQLGTAADVEYILNGVLQKTGTGFSLQLKITDAASGASKAAYTGACPAAELENLTGVKKASAGLLAQLGIALTDAGKTSLLGGAASNAAAETALAKGIAAQRDATVVEALSYYYEAAKFDPGLAEAVSRGSALSADIQGGNIGENVRSDIQTRNAWNKTLQEAAAFFKEHPPFELIYDPVLSTGKIDYAKETAEMSFKAKLIGTTGFKIIYDLDHGLQKTGRSRDWGIGVNSIYREIPDRYEFDAILVNEDGETIGRTTRRFEPRDKSYNFSHEDATVVFSGVDAAKTSDRLTASIVSVNGIDAKDAGERGYMSISVEDFAALGGSSFEVGWRYGGIEITKYKGTGKNVVIPVKISRWPVTSIGNSAFYINWITSVTIPDSVTSIGSGAFSYNRLTSVTIPDSVTSIGAWAFEYNNLTSVTILPGVRSIEKAAFSNNKKLTSVTLAANVNLDSYALPCEKTYNANGKKAGTYVLNVERENMYGELSGTWTIK